jgi:hypothetical protein
MTNYCTNLIEVEGPAPDLANFRSTCLNDNGDLDFEAIIPTPPILRGTHRGGGDRFGWDVELGASALNRSDVRLPFSDDTPILEREPAKKAGIRSFEQLEVWLRKNRPMAIELGALGLQAYKETGYLVEQNWQVANWGTDYWEGLTIREESEKRFVAEFLTAWSPAANIYRELARRFPTLAITVSAMEEGNDLSYRFMSLNGDVSEEEPGLTAEFVGHIEGKTRNVNEFYLKPAELREEPPTHFRYWLAKRRMHRALTGYPIYSPPHEGIEMAMLEKDARANFHYFMSQRAARTEALRQFLASFGVSLGFSEAVKFSLDRWFAKYGAFLYVYENGSSFDTRLPAWEGARSGLNVIHDLAIFLGDFAIKECPKLYWEMYTDVPTGMRTGHTHFQKPAIAGFPSNPRWRFYPLTDVHRICHALHEQSYMWKKPMFSMHPRSLYTQFVSYELTKIYVQARDKTAS